jgi:DNA-binding CsgD family transcriptional regulator
LAVIGGEAGIGKSRLLQEITAEAQATGMRWLIGGAADYGDGGLPLGAVVEALRPAGYFDSSLTEAERSAGQPEPPDGASVESYRRLFEGLLEVIERMASDQPTVLALEDLHWADTSTREFVALLARNLGAMRLLVLATYRSDDVGRAHPLRRYLLELARSPAVERLELERLGRDEVGQQMNAIRGSKIGDDELQRIFHRSQGNPFFTEELLASDAAGAGVPDGLRETLLLRVERLVPHARSVVAALAVAVDADERLLADTSGLAEDDAFSGLRSAIDGQVIERSEQGGYGFRHALLREAVRDDLLPGQLARMHERVAQSLASQSATGWDAQRLARIAYHWQAGGRPREAIVAAWRAALGAENAAAYAEAVLQYERVLELWHLVGEPTELIAAAEGLVVPADRVDVLLRAGWAAHTAGELARASGHFAAAHELIEAPVDPERAAMATVGMIVTGAEGDRAREMLHAALQLAPLCREPVRLSLLSHLMEVLILFSDDEAPRIARELVAAADASGDRQLRIRAHGSAGRVEALWHDVASGLRHNDLARELAVATGDERAVAAIDKDRATILQMAGRFVEGLAVMERSQAVARRLGQVRIVRHNSAEIGQMLYRLGRWQEAEEELDQALQPPAAEWARVLRGQLLVGLGRFEEAALELDRARAGVEATISSASSGPYYAALAEMAIWQRRPADARAALEVGLPLQRAQVDMRWVADQSLLALRAYERPTDEGLAWTRSILDDFAQLATKELERPTIATDEVRAALATADAEWARLRGDHDPDAWSRAIDAWHALSEPYPHAYALYRRAAAVLAVADRPAASESLREASRIATALSAGPLLAAIGELARRARLDIGQRMPVTAGDEAASYGLTAREREVLGLLARGYSDQRIAEALFISPKTASVHVSNVKGKLGVEHRIEAATIGLRLGLATGEDAPTG